MNASLSLSLSPLAIYVRASLMCLALRNDNHKINMSERTSAYHPFTSQHTHSHTHLPRAHMPSAIHKHAGSQETRVRCKWKRATARVSEQETEWEWERERVRRIQIQTNDTIALSLFVYSCDTTLLTHIIPTKNEGNIKFLLLSPSCDLFLSK